MKKLINTLLTITSVLAIGLCAVIAIKSPTTFTDLIGLNETTGSSKRDVPYFANFGDLTSATNDTSYKTQYFSYDKQAWYCSYGNIAGEDYDFILGWNSNSKPTYGSYSYLEDVMKPITLPSGIAVNYSYLLMDFDFNKNHQMEWTFSAIDGLSTATNTKVYLIGSTNSGTSWTILDSKNNTSLVKNYTQAFTHTVDNLMPTLMRYGLVLVSENTSARINVNTFYAKRISLS